MWIVLQGNFSSTKLHDLTWSISKSISIKGCSSGHNIVEIDLSLGDSFTLHSSGSLDIQTVSLDTAGITQIETISLKTLVFSYFHCCWSVSIILSQDYHFQSFSCPWQSLCSIFSVSLRQLRTAQCRRISYSLCQTPENLCKCSKTTDGCLSSVSWFLLFCQF